MKVMVSDVWKVELGLFESKRVCFCLCFAALLGHFERSAGVVRAWQGGGGEAVVFFWFSVILYMALWDQTSDLVVLVWLVVLQSAVVLVCWWRLGGVIGGGGCALGARGLLAEVSDAMTWGLVGCSWWAGGSWSW